ncbi:MAG TPA: hypothetical protein VF198_18060 [Vicinamibacterales bacterium]
MRRLCGSRPGRVVPAAALVLAAALSAAAGAPDPITVRLLPATVMEHNDVKAMVTVEERAENRRLVVSLDGPEFYSSTQRTLDGKKGPRSHEFFFRALPAGVYELRVTVEDDRGHTASVARNFQVHGMSQEEEVVPTGRRRRPPGQRFRP